MSFKLGDRVEVRSDEKGFVGVWYSAEIVHLDNSASCRVEFSELLDAEELPLQEEALLKNVRPLPPELLQKTWLKGDKVEAYDRDGWWAGVISRVLSKDMFSVYFPFTTEELAFPRFKLRCVLDWQDRKWLNLTKVARLERQIEALAEVDVDNKKKPGRKRKDSDGELRNQEIPAVRSLASSPESKSRKRGRKPRKTPVVHSDETFATNEATLEEQRDGSMVTGSQREEEEDVFTEPMRLELTAYRWLLQALYSKGSLTWEQEVLLTDVRCQLEITNCEHALLLKKAVSSGAKQ